MVMFQDMFSSGHIRPPAGWISVLLAGAVTAAGQAGSPAPANPESAPATRATVSTMVQPALSNVQHSISGLNISRWKAPGEVRGAAQQNAASIQRDLTDTLPGLLTQADAAPGTVSPSFAVYRNIDALYDVLLRVYQTASLAAPQGEADSLRSALQQLEAARRQLGDTILNDSKEHEAQLVQLEAALKAAKETHQEAAPAKTTVVDDGPTPPPKKKKKPAAKPSSSGSQGGSQGGGQAGSQAPPGQNP